MQRGVAAVALVSQRVRDRYSIQGHPSVGGALIAPGLVRVPHGILCVHASVCVRVRAWAR